MADLMRLVKIRQGTLSNEKYAAQIGLTGSTLWRYHNGQSRVDLDATQKLAVYFANTNDIEMLGALVAYAIGIDPDKNGLERIGETLLNLYVNP